MVITRGVLDSPGRQTYIIDRAGARSKSTFTAMDFRSHFSGCQLLRASLREVRRLRDLEAVQTRCGEARIWR